jgi:hypothetical protein
VPVPLEQRCAELADEPGGRTLPDAGSGLKQRPALERWPEGSR